MARRPTRTPRHPTLADERQRALAVRAAATEMLEGMRERLQRVCDEYFDGVRQRFAVAVDVNPATITAWIGPQHRAVKSLPTATALARICHATGVSADWLLTGQGPERRGTTRRDAALARDLEAWVAGRVPIPRDVPRVRQLIASPRARGGAGGALKGHLAPVPYYPTTNSSKGVWRNVPVVRRLIDGEALLRYCVRVVRERVEGAVEMLRIRDWESKAKARAKR